MNWTHRQIAAYALIFFAAAFLAAVATSLGVFTARGILSITSDAWIFSPSDNLATIIGGTLGGFFTLSAAVIAWRLSEGQRLRTAAENDERALLRIAGVISAMQMEMKEEVERLSIISHEHFDINDILKNGRRVVVESKQRADRIFNQIFQTHLEQIDAMETQHIIDDLSKIQNSTRSEGKKLVKLIDAIAVNQKGLTDEEKRASFTKICASYEKSLQSFHKQADKCKKELMTYLESRA